jgi:predicted phosphate transport protein (TIGR00153 family)
MPVHARTNRALKNVTNLCNKTYERASMFGRLMPTEGKFFDLFNQHADLCVKGAKEMVALMTNFDDLENRAHAIEGIEKQADKVTHSTLELLHKTFITPLDRDDIHQLITRMDDILDLLEDAAQTISLYDIKAVTPEAKRLAELCLACTERVNAAVALLHSMDNSKEILTICEEIDRIESDADHVMRAAMSKLFRDEPDVRNLIKLKAIYEILETVTDRCEDVANIIEGIIVENA